MASNENLYDVVWPRSERQAQLEALAPRLDTLEGKTVVELWDYLFQGDEVFSALEEGLKGRYPGINFVSWREFTSTHGEGERELLEGLPERLKALGADAVISGMGC